MAQPEHRLSESPGRVQDDPLNFGLTVVQVQQSLPGRTAGGTGSPNLRKSQTDELKRTGWARFGGATDAAGIGILIIKKIGKQVVKIGI